MANTPSAVEQAAMRKIYLRPYKAGFDSGALSAMASFNEINGVPSTGNHWLMTDLLRGEWGFQGFVVSDYTGDEEMIAAGFARDERDASRLAFLAGVVAFGIEVGVVAEVEVLEDRAREPGECLLVAQRRRQFVEVFAGTLLDPNGKSTSLPGKTSLQAKVGSVLKIETPGGGAWGKSTNGNKSRRRTSSRNL